MFDDVNLFYKVVKKFVIIDLSLKNILNYDMGLVFEELICCFVESFNEIVGEYFIFCDIVWLIIFLVFMEDDDVLIKEGIIRIIYDLMVGMGGFFLFGMEYVYELNFNVVMWVFG